MAPRLTPPLSTSQQIAIAIIPKFTASLSLLGSGYIVQHVLRSPKRRRRVYHRILLGMSTMDVISSFKSFLSTWPAPRGTPGVWGAVGTTQTCTAAGFFGHGSSLASPLYNGSLTLYYVLTIRYGWRLKDSDAKLSRLEPWLHAVPLSVGWGTAIAGLPLLLYNSIGWTCWIAPLPMFCRQTYQYGYTTCERGDNSYIYRWAFFHAELWLTFLLTAVGMALIYCFVLKGERATEQYRPEGEGHRNRGERRRMQSRRVAHQAMLYVAAYYLTWIFPAVTWLTQIVQGKTYTIILFLQAIFVPLQGMFNVWIYLRPRYIRYRDRNPDAPFFRAAKNALSSAVDSGGRAREDGGPNQTPSRAAAIARKGRDSDVHSFYNDRNSQNVSWLRSSYDWWRERLGRGKDGRGENLGSLESDAQSAVEVAQSDGLGGRQQSEDADSFDSFRSGGGQEKEDEETRTIDLVAEGEKKVVKNDIPEIGVEHVVVENEVGNPADTDEEELEIFQELVE